MTGEFVSSTGEKALVRASDDSISVVLAEIEASFSTKWNGVAEGVITSPRRSRRFFAYRRGDEVDIWLDGEIHRIGKAESVPRGAERDASSSGEVIASMPGMVVRVLVSEGDTVAMGDGIVVIESMKMQLTLTAPRAGTVKDLAATQGAMVEQGAVLARIEPGTSI